ncbi:putative sulfate exporter family transporter [Microlunatus elymi]|uniref:Putative sulfate exporter family transporter n=1 Tax=Microlunatus elymi TaxID=2596828 RepID=A0A516Q3M4_9ACTN|nr:putative sulfate exporter family transporter [Microlunatus elymi]QDP98037.1 putative sulfate exporter family transporter [Microlunatus elymi]
MRTVQIQRSSAAHNVATTLPGIGVAVLIAVLATMIGRLVPVLGGAVPGIVIGVGVAVVVKPGELLAPGIRFAGKYVLQFAVVLLGTQLSIAEVGRVGVESLPVMLGTLTACLGGAWLFGRLLGVVGDLRTLIGVGTGVCGASAIAAAAPVVGAVSMDVAYAVSTIFLFNIAAVITFPLIGHLLGLSQQAFGLFAGTAVNDTSSVVAAATTYGAEAGQYAIVVKLVRSLMIIPICIGLAALAARRARSGGALQPAAGRPSMITQLSRWVPWFLVGFALMAAINSLGFIPDAAHPGLSTASTFMITVALSAIGLSTDVRALRRAGARPLALGALLWVTVGLTSLGLQWLTGAL